ncbi:MAG TPA: UDP-N-acetylglucosamine 1-carboxyvinyltransferase [Patescibacteria group bacterium]|nr:UDP-N-acetylglucosamine 1-carboxyvinyltransferase [Patescibacteria group bacterium]
MNFKIKGGKKLKGTAITNTAKNSAVAMLCASLLNKGKTILRDVPRIEEVERINEVLKSIGVKIKWLSHSDLEITPPNKVNMKEIDQKAAIKTRSIILTLGALIHDFKNFKIPQAGGCKLGARTVKPHFFALENLGVDIQTKKNYYEIKHKGLKSNKIVLYEAGDTVTENAIMAASKIPGETIIKKASANYQVQDLCNFLTKLGITIKGIGTTTLKIYGKKDLNKNIEYHLCEDPIESMLYISIAATTNSEITIKRCPIEFLELELLKLEKMGFNFKISKTYKSKNGFTDLVDIKTYKSDLKALNEKIAPRPFPGINIDNLPFFVPIATQAKGETLIHDWVYENRAIYYTELQKLGADINLADPHRVYIKGKTNLKANEIIAPPALRPAAIILIAMLAAPGESILRNVYSIRRGYEDLANRLSKELGADIKRID